jgi:hypothetical protein
LKKYSPERFGLRGGRGRKKSPATRFVALSIFKCRISDSLTKRALTAIPEQGGACFNLTHTHTATRCAARRMLCAPATWTRAAHSARTLPLHTPFPMLFRTGRPLAGVCFPVLHCPGRVNATAGGVKEEQRCCSYPPFRSVAAVLGTWVGFTLRAVRSIFPAFLRSLFLAVPTALFPVGGAAAQGGHSSCASAHFAVDAVRAAVDTEMMAAHGRAARTRQRLSQHSQHRQGAQHLAAFMQPVCEECLQPQQWEAAAAPANKKEIARSRGRFMWQVWWIHG